MSMSTDEKVMLVDSRGRGMEISTYRSVFEMVQSLLGSGKLADGSYGSDEHIRALERLIACIKSDLEAIRQFRENEKEPVPAAKDKPPSGVDLIAAERTRQIVKEGFDAFQDAGYRDGELLRGAICYADFELQETKKPPENWPLSIEWWKPSTDPVRNLVKAGALIAAEIDRIQNERD